MSETTAKLAYSIREFEKAVGLSHSTIYELIAAGELQTFNVGRRRFVSVESGRSFIAKREAAAG